MFSVNESGKKQNYNFWPPQTMMKWALTPIPAEWLLTAAAFPLSLKLMPSMSKDGKITPFFFFFSTKNKPVCFSIFLDLSYQPATSVLVRPVFIES